MNLNLKQVEEMEINMILFMKKIKKTEVEAEAEAKKMIIEQKIECDIIISNIFSNF